MIADELRRKPRTIAHYLDEIPDLYAALLGALQRAGDHVRKDAFLRRSQAACPPPALTNELLLDKSEADAEENVARDAYELERTPATCSTLIRRLRKEAALATAVADALEAVA